MTSAEKTDPHPPTAELARLDVAALTERFATGALTSRALVQSLLERIDALDEAGPTIRSVLARNPDAVDDAEGRDRERDAGAIRGPLHGVPVLIKDNIDTAGAMGTTAGSLALRDVAVPRDAVLVRRLRDAGAVVLGKTNLSEWANIRSSTSTSGWSGVGGLTVNPWALDRSAGGSSSGSGAAVAAGLAPLAVGTETDGSVICPAALCGVVGVKPTVGRVSRTGVVPISASQDTPGVFARSIASAAVLLAALTGPDPLDAVTTTAPRMPDVSTALDLTGLRIGLPREGLWGYSRVADTLTEAAVAVLEAAGATIVDHAEITTMDELHHGSDELTVLLYELQDGLRRYLATRPGGPTSVADVVAYNAAHADAELAYFGQDLLERAAALGPISEGAYLEARVTARRLGGTDGIDAVLARHQLDALVAPAYPPAWKIDLVNGDQSRGGCPQAAAVAGYPIVTVPAGLADGLPVGVAFIGTAWAEPVLLRLAAAYERARGPFPTPAFRAARIG